MQNPFHRHQFSSATDSINWSEKQILQGILETEAESRRTAAMQTHVWGNNGRVFENESCWLCFITLIFSSFDLFFNIKNKPPAPKKKKEETRKEKESDFSSDSYVKQREARTKWSLCSRCLV